jgi:hypothetical protein
VVHAVRGRVAAVQPFLEVLLQASTGSLTESQRVCLEAIDRNLRRLFVDVTETLQLLRPEMAQLRVEPEELGCASLLHDAAQLLKSRELPEPTIQEPNAGLRVRADAARTSAVLAALAARATGSGAPTLLSAARYSSAPGLICIYVGTHACAGSGCPPPVVQDPVDASILLCRALVEDQGGRVWIGSGGYAGAACVALPEAAPEPS